MEEVYRQYAGRAPFSYDAAADPLFQSYRDAYTQSGKLAMRDTLGQAASLTGGYVSSYGQAAGQQAYDAYLQKLGEVIPTLYGLASERYQGEGDRLLNQHSMLEGQREAAYSRYRDALGDWESDRAWQSEQAERAYQRAADAEERDYQRAADADNSAYQRKKDSYASLYTAIKTGGYRPTDEELTAAGMTRAAADALLAEYRRGVDLAEREIAVKESTANGGSGIANELWDYDPERGWFVTARR
jgi:hypothetical protein